jgi:signal peptidase I
MPSASMVPTIKTGEVIRADTSAYVSGASPKRNDIVVLHPPVGADEHRCGLPSQPADGHPCAKPTAGALQTLFLKRVVGLPGDDLAFANNRTVLGGRRLDEPFVNSKTLCGELCNLRKPITVPPDHYYVVGDNRGESDDSRDWGPVPRESIVGKVLGKE